MKRRCAEAARRRRKAAISGRRARAAALKPDAIESAVSRSTPRHHRS